MVQNTEARGAGARFLITGAKGFIGAWIVKNLVERGDHPWVFDLDAGSHRLRALLSDEQMTRVGYVRGDGTNLEDLERAVAEHGSSHLIHLAALQVPACAANPPLGAPINLIGTLNVFEAARRRHGLWKRGVCARSGAHFRSEQ